LINDILRKKKSNASLSKRSYKNEQIFEKGHNKRTDRVFIDKKTLIKYT